MKKQNYPRVTTGGPNSHAVMIALSPLTRVAVALVGGDYLAVWYLRARHTGGWVAVNQLKLSGIEDAIALLRYELGDRRAVDRVHRWSGRWWTQIAANY